MIPNVRIYVINVRLEKKSLKSWNLNMKLNIWSSWIKQNKKLQVLNLLVINWQKNEERFLISYIIIASIIDYELNWVGVWIGKIIFDS